MNRQQKRKLSKNYKKMMAAEGVSKPLRDFYSKIYFNEKKNSKNIEEGTKVKINTKEIKKRGVSPLLESWLEEHKDDIFTVEYEEKYKEKKVLCCLKEDTTTPKWLFWTGDLDIVEE